MNPWPIAAICLMGAGFIAFWSAYARIRWVPAVLALLMAVIALQLFAAYRGDGQYHDLSAFRAMMATVLPGLAGTVIGLSLGSWLGAGLLWRTAWGVVTALALLAVAGALLAAWRL